MTVPDFKKGQADERRRPLISLTLLHFKSAVIPTNGRDLERAYRKPAFLLYPMEEKKAVIPTNGRDLERAYRKPTFLLQPMEEKKAVIPTNEGRFLAALEMTRLGFKKVRSKGKIVFWQFEA